MQRILAAICYFVCSACLAEPAVINVPSLGWTVKFDAPSTKVLKEESSATAYYYSSNAGNFNLSLFIGKPNCAGDTDLEAYFKCFAEKAEKVPGIVKQSVRVNKITNGVQFSYLTYVPIDGKATKVLNTHLLFASKGMWGDLHGSVIKPSIEDISMLMGLGDKFEYSN